MIFNPLEYANRIATQRLFAEHLYPETRWRLGTRESYSFRRADVTCTHVGNRTGLPDHARSYRYRVKGEGFFASILATWIEATARISVETISDPIAFNCWLRNERLEDGYPLAEAASTLADWYRYCADPSSDVSRLMLTANKI